MRTSNGSVVQFLYGEDGMDGTAIEAQKLDALRMPPGKFRVRARFLSTPHTQALSIAIEAQELDLHAARQVPGARVRRLSGHPLGAHASAFQHLM